MREYATKNPERTGPCPGSGTKGQRKGSKYTYSGLKYPCPECGKLYLLDTNGNLNKHGYKLTGQGKLRRDMKAGKSVSLCAECGDLIQGIDYLCAVCRS